MEQERAYIPLISFTPCKSAKRRIISPLKSRDWKSICFRDRRRIGREKNSSRIMRCFLSSRRTSANLDYILNFGCGGIIGRAIVMRLCRTDNAIRIIIDIFTQLTATHVELPFIRNLHIWRIIGLQQKNINMVNMMVSCHDQQRESNTAQRFF